MFEPVDVTSAYLDVTHNYQIVAQTNTCQSIKIATKSEFYIIKHYHTSIRDAQGRVWYLNELQNENISVRAAAAAAGEDDDDYVLSIFPMCRIYKANIKIAFFLETISVHIDCDSASQSVSYHIELQRKPTRIIDNFETFHLFRVISKRHVPSLATICSKFILTKKLTYDIMLPTRIRESLNQLNFVYSDFLQSK